MTTDETKADHGAQSARRTWSFRTAAAAALVAGAATLLLVPLGNDYRALWYGQATDAGHVVLFAAITWLLAHFALPGRPIAAAAAALALAAGAEMFQPLIGRSASWQDLFYGLVGVGIALAWLLPGKWPIKVIATLALVAAPLAQTMPLVIDAWNAWRSFPVLASFESPLETRRWMFQGVTVARAQPPGAIFEFAANEKGSGAILLPVVRDWTGYRTLEIDFAFEGAPMVFLISVRDGKKLPPELPRFDLWRRYESGSHQVRIDLGELARGGDFPPIDLSRVQSLHLVAYSDQPHRVTLKRIELTQRNKHQASSTK